MLLGALNSIYFSVKRDMVAQLLCSPCTFFWDFNPHRPGLSTSRWLVVEESVLCRKPQACLLVRSEGSSTLEQIFVSIHLRLSPASACRHTDRKGN